MWALPRLVICAGGLWDRQRRGEHPSARLFTVTVPPDIARMPFRRTRPLPALVLWALLLPVPLAAQDWGGAEARALVERAVVRRREAFADSQLTDWSARAHGFVFFLGQIGEGLSEPPRLIKADQLELEVFWRAPSLSKQRIIGWRDRRDLPTDINYHRDHLGIVMNNFPDLIRLGEGDEVRDVPHPVSAAGAELYEFALVDSLEIRSPSRAIRVYELRFRPRDFRAARIVGSVFLDVDAAELVRMTFNFTRAAYRDDQLEDITVAVENSLMGGRWWLPVRQEIEIRRRATWLDFPARGIIRGRFEIDGYRFNQGLEPGLFRGPEIVALPPAVRDTFPWPEPLDAAIRDVGRPANLQDFDAVRAEVQAVAMGHVLTGLRQAQVAGGAVSDFAHVNRVEGLFLGAGGVLRSGDQARELRLRAGTATSTVLISGGGTFGLRLGATTWRLQASREVRDIGDLAVISRAVNSISAQEAGNDYGDYYLAAGAGAGVTRSLGGRSSLHLDAGWVRVDSLDATAEWARGVYARPNPGVDEGGWTTVRAVWQRRTPSFASPRDLSGRVEVEGGLGPADYFRAFGELRWQTPVSPGASLLVRAAAGGASGQLPRHRAFVLGGRGTLLGEPFRAFGGRRMAWLSGEWQQRIGIPEVRLGSFAGTGPSAVFAPNIAVGWAGGQVPDFFAAPSPGPEVAVGLGFAWLHGLLRFDAGYGVRSRLVAFAVDVSRDFWEIL